MKMGIVRCENVYLAPRYPNSKLPRLSVFGFDDENGRPCVIGARGLFWPDIADYVVTDDRCDEFVSVTKIRDGLVLQGGSRAKDGEIVWEDCVQPVVAVGVKKNGSIAFLTISDMHGLDRHELCEENTRSPFRVMQWDGSAYVEYVENIDIDEHGRPINV